MGQVDTDSLDNAAPDALAAGLDAIDRELIAQLSRRFALVREAARQQAGSGVNDEMLHRGLQIAARRRAFEANVPVGLVSDMWERMAEAAQAFERQAVERRRVANG